MLRARVGQGGAAPGVGGLRITIDNIVKNHHYEFYAKNDAFVAQLGLGDGPPHGYSLAHLNAQQMEDYPRM